LARRRNGRPRSDRRWHRRRTRGRGRPAPRRLPAAPAGDRYSAGARMSDITDAEWQLIREHFGDMAYEEPHNHQGVLKVIKREILERYSRGHLSARAAAGKLGLRDSADLLVALGDVGLPMPQPPAEEVRKQ